MTDDFIFKINTKDGNDTAIWNPTETAAIVIDMWDRHWCKGASERVDELAPNMDQFLTFLRQKGLKKVIHCPTNVSAYYSESYARKKTKEYSNETVPIPESKIPDIRSIVDPHAVQCDCEVKCNRKEKPWTRQTSKITILGEGPEEVSDYDLICDEYLDGSEKNKKENIKEWYLFHALEELKIKNIFIMGVHTNMCVIYRNFGIKNLAALGKYNLVLVSDMTDGMLPREEMPYKNHFDALEDVFTFIKKYFCPITRSEDITGKQWPYFNSDERHHILLDRDQIKDFNQQSIQQASKHKFPIGMRYVYDKNCIKDITFIYDYDQNEIINSDSMTSNVSSIQSLASDAVNKQAMSQMFPLGARIRKFTVYIEDHKLAGMCIHIHSDIAPVTHDYCIGSPSQKSDSRTFSAPEGMALASFYGGKNENEEIVWLGANCISETYFKKQRLGHSNGETVSGFSFRNWNNEICKTECIEGTFWVYSNNDRNDFKATPSLEYLAVNKTPWKTKIDGISFLHQDGKNEKIYHKSAIIAFIGKDGDCDKEYMVSFCNSKGHLYIPESEQQTNYKDEDINKPIPYYQRTSL